MEIKIPLPTTALTTAQGKLDSLSLQLNQQVNVKVIDANIGPNRLALEFAGKTLQLQSNQPMDVKIDQQLTLQLIKLQPLLEFKLLDRSDQTSQSERSSPSAPANLQPAEIILKQVLPQVKNGIEPDQTMPKQFLQGQQLTVILTAITGKNLSFQVVSDKPSQDHKTPPTQTLTLSLNQITNLSGFKAEVTSDLSTLKSGQLLSLELVKFGDPPQFKLLPNSTTVTPEQIITDTVKRYLPIQQSPSPLLQQLFATLSANDTNTTVPETLKRLAQEILQSLPQRSQLTQTETLKHYLSNSGRFLESKLSQISHNPHIDLQHDFKLKLLKFIDHLQQQLDPKAELKTQNQELNLFRELLQKSTGTLARIILDQLNSLPKEEGNKQTWTLELPFLNRQQVDQVTIEFEQQKQAEDQQQKSTWSVNITVTPPQLGTIHCKIISYDHVVSTRFWSEQPTTVATIHHHLNYLRQQLEHNGIQPGVIEVQQGKPNQAAPAQFSGQNLLNEKV